MPLILAPLRARDYNSCTMSEFAANESFTHGHYNEHETHDIMPLAEHPVFHQAQQLQQDMQELGEVDEDEAFDYYDGIYRQEVSELNSEANQAGLYGEPLTLLGDDTSIFRHSPQFNASPAADLAVYSSHHIPADGTADDDTERQARYADAVSGAFCGFGIRIVPDEEYETTRYELFVRVQVGAPLETMHGTFTPCHSGRVGEVGLHFAADKQPEAVPPAADNTERDLINRLETILDTHIPSEEALHEYVTAASQLINLNPNNKQDIQLQDQLIAALKSQFDYLLGNPIAIDTPVILSHEGNGESKKLALHKENYGTYFELRDIVCLPAISKNRQGYRIPKRAGSPTAKQSLYFAGESLETDTHYGVVYIPIEHAEIM